MLRDDSDPEFAAHFREDQILGERADNPLVNNIGTDLHAVCGIPSS